MGVQYGVAVPLTISGVLNNDPGLVISGRVLGFYKAGWVINGIGAVLNVASSFDSKSENAMSMPLMFLGIASNAMFITSVATASGYTGSALNKVDDTAIKMDIVPVVSLHDKKTGVLLNFSF
jgi:hypothetical protein